MNEFEFLEGYKKLSAPFSNLKARVGHGKQSYTYVSTQDIIKRLNSVFGLSWSFEIVKEELVYSPVSVHRTKRDFSDALNMQMVHNKEEEKSTEEKQNDTKEKVVVEIENRPVAVTVLARITVSDSNGNTYIKEQYGSSDIKYFSDGSGMVDIGNDKKSAASDALKKCATLMGVALDLGNTTITDEQKEEIKTLFSELGGNIPEDRLAEMSFMEADKVILALKEKKERMIK